ncbi:Tn3 family transposase [Streptomyces sp. NPDC059010]|uniref:Tn3 family transposase n=1 Tax=Streptomyces sp. NPDC059010 TaxID=3346695 RepID=UPI0036868A4F
MSNAVIFHDALGIAEIVRRRRAEGMGIAPEDLAPVSPYVTGPIRRFGEYSTHGLGDGPDAYGPRLDVDFTPVRGDEQAAGGFSQAA